VHVQQAYLYERPAAYAALAAKAAAEAPHVYADLTEIDAMIVGGDLYRTQKNLRKLIRVRDTSGICRARRQEA
jgi:hypothetical protein